ncbi:aminotransferase class V-fold PLP-dependent enzyme [Oscillatoria amoena NRMC-F 0135]|nr:aminotransferase class V-fold PLP-dependent enzyme [Oscillatoria amoena NRMC-F 0135]
MAAVSFYPGPSRVYPKVKRYLQDAYAANIMSISHRSDDFMVLSKKTSNLLKEKLDIPPDYSVYFVSSATECWEIIAQSLIGKESVHLFNGAFGQKWFEYTKKLKPEAQAFPFDLHSALVPAKFNTGEVICITQNETSNGTQVSERIIRSIRQKNPEHLLAVDATSSMAGVNLNFSLADVWFASVQKCFGLPAGLGVFICSPRALQKARRVGDRLHYNSLLMMEEMGQKNQTTHTPNVFDIYLLMRVMESVKPIEKVSKMIRGRYNKWEAFFDTKTHNLNFLVNEKSLRSRTVLTIQTSAEAVQKIQTASAKAGFLLGNGYGNLKETTFRIANFPAIQRREIAQLMDFIHHYI